MEMKEIQREWFVKKISLSHTFVTFLFMLLFATGGVVNAEYYDLSDDWSDTENPNGVWSYYVNGDLAISGMRGGDPFNSPGQPIWMGASGNFIGWSKSNGTNVRDWDIETGDVYGHTGTIDIRWTSPGAGTAYVDGGVWAIRDVGRSNYWQITLTNTTGTTTLANGYVYSGDPYDRSNPFPIDLMFDVVAGDVLKFTTRADGIYGNGWIDYIALDLAINVVPLPATILLGLLGLGVGGWKLRKST